MLPFLLYLLPPYMLLYAFAHNMVFNTCSFDSDLSMHVCLSLYDTGPSPHHSLGSSDSPKSACPDFRAWSLWILLVADQRCATEA